METPNGTDNSSYRCFLSARRSRPRRQFLGAGAEIQFGPRRDARLRDQLAELDRRTGPTGFRVASGMPEVGGNSPDGAFPDFDPGCLLDLSVLDADEKCECDADSDADADDRCHSDADDK